MQFRGNKGGNEHEHDFDRRDAGRHRGAFDRLFSSFKTILLFCCAGLVASFGLMARGIDLSAGLM